MSAKVVKCNRCGARKRKQDTREWREVRDLSFEVIGYRCRTAWLINRQDAGGGRQP